MALMSLWCTICLTVSNPPLTKLNTPLGNWISYRYLANKMLVVGTLSLGLRMNVFPKVIDKGIIHNGIIAGKLNGATPAQTPNGNL